MKNKIKEIIEYLKKKVDYADIRHQKKSTEDIKVKNGNVEALATQRWGRTPQEEITQPSGKKLSFLRP